MSDDAPVFNQVNLVVADFRASLEFYRRLGLETLDPDADMGGMEHAEVVMPSGVTLEFDGLSSAQVYNAAWRGPSGGSKALIGFSLPTRDAVDALYAELTASGSAGRQPPYDAFWGARYAIVADPDGNDVGLMSPIEASHRSWPPTESPSL